MNTYEMSATCTCPADKLPDSYRVVIRSRRMIWTNKSGEALRELSKAVIPQEEFTSHLARVLQAEVTTYGQHPSFVDQSVCSAVSVTCRAGAP